ncbi:MAG: RNA polymerase sigma factor [Sphingomonadaceae bacterium]|nr:RNA polymerase sigma factor [Sphingomonadaceae bacterium]
MPQGLEAIFFEHRDLLQRFLRARGAGEQAEDLVQEVWLRASAKGSGPIGNPRSYLFRVAHNLMIDIHRSDVQRSRREEYWSDANGGDLAEVSDEPSAERAVIAQSMLARAHDVMDELGEPTTTIFRRFRIDGVGQKTIARDLSVSLATVEKHLQKAYRAMAALKQELDTE